MHTQDDHKDFNTLMKEDRKRTILNLVRILDDQGVEYNDARDILGLKLTKAEQNECLTMLFIAVEK